MVDCLCIAFKEGQGHLGVATMALRALERWCDHAPQHMTEHLPRVLPLLTDYINVKDIDRRLSDDETLQSFARCFWVLLSQ